MGLSYQAHEVTFSSPLLALIPIFPPISFILQKRVTDRENISLLPHRGRDVMAFPSPSQNQQAKWRGQEHLAEMF